METFHYDLLPDRTSIRLLKIIELDPLRCEVSHHDLAAYEYVPRYTALSYCWGDASDRCEITCNGKRLSITRTLLVALQMTHDHNPNQYIWADQVCIDQADLVEKSQQIKIMTALYQNAWTVIAWLGPEDSATEVALDQVDKLAAAYVEDEISPELEEKAPGVLKLRPCFSKALYESYEDDVDTWLAFSRFFDRPWFERIWIVQEMLPIQEVDMTRQIEASVVCGSHTVHWNAIVFAAKWVGTAKELHKSPPTHPGQFVDGLYHVQSLGLRPVMRIATVTSSEGVTNRFVGRYTFEILDLLTHYRNRVATDSRDKVYGLIGLSDFSDRDQGRSEMDSHNFIMAPKIPIDYSLSVLEVYRNLARGLISFASEYEERHACDDPCEWDAPGALDFIMSARPGSKDPDWPSWIPDWRSPYDGDTARPLADTGYPSGSIYPRLFDHPDPNCLKVGGILLGHTTWVHDKCHGPDILFIDDFTSLTDTVILHIGPEYTHGETKESTSTAFYNTFTTGRLPTLYQKLEIPHSVYEDKRLLYRMFEIARKRNLSPNELIYPLLHLVRDEAGVDQSTAEKTDAAAKVFVDHFQRLGQFMINTLCERRFFTTDQGYVGVGDHHVQVGDVVAILFGMRKPCILRRFTMDNGEHAYRYIGYAWVRGAMDGEAVADLPKDEFGVPVGQEILLR